MGKTNVPPFRLASCVQRSGRGWSGRRHCPCCAEACPVACMSGMTRNKVQLRMHKPWKHHHHRHRAAAHVATITCSSWSSCLPLPRLDVQAAGPGREVPGLGGMQATCRGTGDWTQAVGQVGGHTRRGTGRDRLAAVAGTLFSCIVPTASMLYGVIAVLASSFVRRKRRFASA
jgi:hypothetical protein